SRFAWIAGALVAAALYTAASPPHDHALLAWLAPGVLLVPLERTGSGRAALAGLVFGLGIAIGITSWAVGASLEYFELARTPAILFAGLVWLVGAGVPYALLGAGFAAIARRTSPVLHPFAAAWLWVVVEAARSVPPLGLPWGLLSHTQWSRPEVLQIAA